MKKLISLTLILSIVLFYSCTNKEVAVQKTKLDKEATMSQITSHFYRVTEVRKIIGNDTTDFLTGSIYDDLSNHIFFAFHSQFLVYYSGGEIPSNPYPQPSKAYGIPTKIAYPTNLSALWDDDEGTLVISSKGAPKQMPIPDGMEARLDKEHFILYNTLEESQAAAIKPSLKFIVKQHEPKDGDVIYYFTLKPVWYYARNPYTANAYFYVMF